MSVDLGQSQVHDNTLSIAGPLELGIINVMGSVVLEDVSLDSPPPIDPLIFFPEYWDVQKKSFPSLPHSRSTCGLPLAVHCVLFSDGEGCFSEWDGPDLFSSLTHTRDVFQFLSMALPGNPVLWLEVRLAIVSLLSGQAMVRPPFLLTPDDRDAGSLRYFQHHAEKYLTYWCSDTGNDSAVLELALWPRRGQHVACIGYARTPAWSHPRTAPMDPDFFVENIVKNFK